MKMLEYSIVITEGSSKLAMELNNYTWSDKKTNTPIDAFNHGIDALRYAVWYQSKKSGTLRASF
jgi:phage terminase large subunit